MSAAALQLVPHSAPDKKQETAPHAFTPLWPAPVITPPLIQRQAHCACGGDCPRCLAEPRAGTNLEVSMPGDASEVEADRVADEVMRMADGATPAQAGQPAERAVLHRSCASRAATKNRAAKNVTGDLSSLVARGTSGGGRALDRNTRAFMERRFGRDFGDVRVHTDATAAESAGALNAHAYTLGNNIIFSAGRYQPQTQQGRRLVAHELAHVLQQHQGSRAARLIQRDCADPNFCTPYATATEAANEESWLRKYYLPTEGTKFGANSRALYERFLSRRPGDSLAPVVFDSPGTDVVSSFAESGATAQDQDAIIDLIGARLHRAPSPLSDYTPTIMSVENFLSRTELDNRPINYSNPFSIAGHIAGGIGSSDAGDDYRKVLWGNVTLEKVPLVGSTGYVSVETTLHYEVFDAIDFCPGDCGSPAEQLITIPMSRLEASGEAYDVPFKVLFVPESRSKRFFYS